MGDDLFFDDGSIEPNKARRRMQETLQFFEDQSSLSSIEQEFVDLIEHTFGTPIMEITDSPFDDYLDTIVGSDEKINNLGERLNEVSTQVARQNRTYKKVYQDNTEEVFEYLEDATL